MEYGEYPVTGTVVSITGTSLTLSGFSYFEELNGTWTKEGGEIATYTITYNANGGSGTVPASQTVNEGSSVMVPDQEYLYRSGYDFIGWNTSSSGNGNSYNPGSYLEMYGNITLYAQWMENTSTQYTVTYNANGGSGTVPASQTVNAGSSVTVAGQGSLTRSGYTFTGWNTSSSGNGNSYNPGSYLTVYEDTILYAQWAENVAQYTVTYNANGGSGTVPASQTVNNGSSVIVAGQGSLTRSGYTFTGWNTSTYGSGTDYNAGSSLTVYENTTLYAQWAENVAQYTVIITSSIPGGSISADPTSGPAGTSVTLSNTPANGYTFRYYTVDGWAIQGDTFTLNSNVTVSAFFKQIMTYNVTITSDITGGSVSASTASGTEGTVVTLSNTPAPGYLFSHYIVKRQNMDDLETVVTWMPWENIQGRTFTLYEENVEISAVFIQTNEPDSVGTIGNPSVKLYLNSGANPLTEGGSTSVGNEGLETYTVSIAGGSYSQIIWYLNGRVYSEGVTETSITLSKQNSGVYLLTIEATLAGGNKNTGSHSFVVEE
jgi:uncharacterized repeat protein (TIGR02543 family)